MLTVQVLPYQNASIAVPRLGIKEYNWWNEALHGVACSRKVMAFLQVIGMKVSFNSELSLAEVFDAISDKARVKFNYYNKIGEYGI